MLELSNDAAPLVYSLSSEFPRHKHPVVSGGEGHSRPEGGGGGGIVDVNRVGGIAHGRQVNRTSTVFMQSAGTGVEH